MKAYRVTLERAIRAVRWIEAENDEEAIKLAERMHYTINDSDYEDGESDSVYDYAVMDDRGLMLKDFYTN